MTTLHRQQGFTLVEVITVMLVLVAIASITVESSKDFVFQNRYEITKDRYEKIRKAIIGDPNQVINGQPNIEGFVKDVGRLPFNLHELTDGYCSANTATQIYPDSTTCTNDASGQWHSKVYLSSADLRDGWGNGTTSDSNYGWKVSFPTANSMNIQSKGKDSEDGGSDYNADYPDTSIRASIEQSDWRVNVDGIQANVMASSINGSCTITSPPIDPATCQLAGRTWTANTPPCEGSAVPASKLGCESVGGIWNYGTPSGICMKINTAKNNNSVQITEDGRENLKQFNFNAFIIPQGSVLVGIYNGLDCSANNLTTYPLNHGEICKNTNDHASFTQANCSGTWKDDGTEQYCYGVTATICTTTLNGTLNKEEIKLTLSPNTTLPTINW